MPIRHPVAFPKGHIVTAPEWIADHTLPTEAELAGILDGRYVNVVGDTMTGPLTIQNDPALDCQISVAGSRI